MDARVHVKQPSELLPAWLAAPAGERSNEGLTAGIELVDMIEAGGERVLPGNFFAGVGGRQRRLQRALDDVGEPMNVVAGRRERSIESLRSGAGFPKLVRGEK